MKCDWALQYSRALCNLLVVLSPWAVKLRNSASQFWCIKIFLSYRVWRQMVADVFQLPVFLLSQLDAAAVGAALQVCWPFQPPVWCWSMMMVKRLIEGEHSQLSAHQCAVQGDCGLCVKWLTAKHKVGRSRSKLFSACWLNPETLSMETSQHTRTCVYSSMPVKARPTFSWLHKHSWPLQAGAAYGSTDVAEYVKRCGPTLSNEVSA